MCWTVTIAFKQCRCNGFRLQRKEGIATSIGHAPISALIDPVAGSRNAIAESLLILGFKEV
jgi:phosphoribosylformylglycinamidine synthase